MVSVDKRASSRSLLSGLIVEARPKQWVKNVLVLAAPAAAGTLLHPHVLGQAGLAFLSFCLASSGTYYLNDAGDVEADRRHPKKRFRPMAAGVFSTTVGRAVGVVLVLVGIAIPLVASRWTLALVVAIYVANTTAYSLLLKHRAVFDILSVSAGFLLRAIGGAAATDTALSNWFLTVASFGSLFIVVGKRFSEQRSTAQDPSGHVRAVLNVYTIEYLQYLRAVSTSGVLVAYCLFAFERAGQSAVSFPWYQLSVIPFAGAILKYALLVESGHGEAPEDVLLGNRVLLAAGVVWVVLFLGGAYGVG